MHSFFQMTFEKNKSSKFSGLHKDAKKQKNKWQLGCRETRTSELTTILGSNANIKSIHNLEFLRMCAGYLVN